MTIATESLGLNMENSMTEVSFQVGNKVYKSDILTIGPDGILDIYEIKMGFHAGFTPNQKYTLPLMFDGEPVIPFGGNAWKANELFKGAITPGVPINNYRIHVIHYLPK